VDATQVEAAAPAVRSRVRTRFQGVPLQRLLALAALVILLVFFSVIAPPFRTWDNFVTILLATAVNGVLAMGVTFVRDSAADPPPRHTDGPI
jgi:predicted ABC-type sugar transport system permease subunit